MVDLAHVMKKYPQANLLRGPCGQSSDVLGRMEFHNAIAKAYNHVRQQISHELDEKTRDRLLRVLEELACVLGATPTKEEVK